MLGSAIFSDSLLRRNPLRHHLKSVLDDLFEVVQGIGEAFPFFVRQARDNVQAADLFPYCSYLIAGLLGHQQSGVPSCLLKLYYERAQTRLHEGDDKGAIADLNRALQSDPRMALA